MRHPLISRIMILLVCAGLLAACALPGISELRNIPGMPDLARLTDIPGIPRELADVPNLLEDLNLGDLANLENLPGIDTLPFLRTPPGALVLRGPVERNLRIGDGLAGTDIVLSGIEPDGAVFEIAGMRSVRTYADSLDFDGGWAGLEGVSYNLRLRVYQITNNSVRAAGVQQLVVPNVAPVATGTVAADNRIELSFPVTWGLAPGEAILGTTLRYVGMQERGAEFAGLGDGVFPFHKIGDSLRWRGNLRTDLAADYQLRVLAYGTDSARVGGVVSVWLPAP